MGACIAVHIERRYQGKTFSSGLDIVLSSHGIVSVVLYGSLGNLC